MRVLVTGSSGLVGSEAVEHFDRQGHQVHGLDNNMRREFFGPGGDTTWNLERLKRDTRAFRPLDVDICDREQILDLFRVHRFEMIVHCAAQPSHDRAATIPLIDFDVNAVGTVNLLEAARRHCPEAPFIHMSTNKVYGDAPNDLPLVELDQRYDYAQLEDYHGIGEECRIDRSLHSLFGASKAASDLMAQEYGRYFGMPIGVFRAGCITGPSHSGVELHGFLSYLVKVAVREEPYTIYGYKGKQVRDQIHSADLVSAFEAYARNPRPGEVYNVGGGRDNSASVLESIAAIEAISGTRVRFTYDERHRRGDHICYISDLRKLTSHYPEWRITRPLDGILKEMVEAERSRPTVSR